MDKTELWRLHREGRDAELLRQAAALAPGQVDDPDLCELLGELSAGAGDAARAAGWYRAADTPAARQALPLLLLKLGRAEEARALLDGQSVRGAEWHEAEYLLLLSRGPDPDARLEALAALLDEQYAEPYMAEYAALCLLHGREAKGRRTAKKQLSLFPGGAWEDAARTLLEEGPGGAEGVLAALEAARPIRPSGERPGVGGQAAPPADPAPVSAPAPAPDSAPLPEPVERCFAGIVGMEGARRVLADLYAAVKMQEARASYELSAQTHCHLLIRGGPGSGKSLLAGRVSALLHELGANREAAPCVLEGHQLGEFLGGGGGGLEQALEPCEGRTVVIDGLDALFQGDDAAGRPALFHAVLERCRGRINFLLLGSDRDIDHLLTLEPTLAGWFLHDISLEPQGPEALGEVAQAIARSGGYVLSADAKAALVRRLEEEHRSPAFRGGKTVEAIIGKASLNLARRLSRGGTVSKGALMRIEAEDLEEAAEHARLEDLLAELDGLTGLASVKEQVHRLAALARANREAKRLGLGSAGFGTLHMVFAGSAGTGKTTVARIVGGIYRALGILPQGDKVVECTRADLVGQYVGHTAPRVKAKVEEAMGGVLFIDEAYALCGENDSFGREAVDALVAEIENHRADLMVILAGYSEGMDRFLEKNQGLSSRFPNRMEFADYSQAELEQIFRGMLAAAGKRLDAGTDDLVRACIAERRGRRGFGNARGARNLRDRLIEAQSLRLTARMEAGETLTAEDFALLTAEDLSTLVEDASREKTLEDHMAKLRGLTGLQSVKDQVERKVYMVLAQQRMQEQSLAKGLDFGTLHMVFRGSAGTGKTTVARLLGGIYNALGLLPDGETFVECTRSDLVGQYQGQTALKVKEVVNRALGGVLFVDEAYALCRDAHDTFGREAVDALVADMENHRGELMVILAGYSEDMDAFFEHNQGLASRVPTSLTFEDYAPAELFQIFRGILAGKGFTLDGEAARAAEDLIARESRRRNFGNARGVRNVAERVAERHAARLGERLSRGEELGRDEYLTILPEDVLRAEEGGEP